MGFKTMKPFCSTFISRFLVVIFPNIPLFHHSNIPVSQRHELHPSGVHSELERPGRIFTHRPVYSHKLLTNDQ